MLFHKEIIMSQEIRLIAVLILAVSILGRARLGSAMASSAQPDAGNPSVAAADDTSGLNGLNAADRRAAEKQKTCPVTDELLGSMGTPVKLKVKGRTVFLCCAGCKGKLLKNPDKYLQKLDKQTQK
jgi:hypothetical protein